jgi:hypothetical protein
MTDPIEYLSGSENWKNLANRYPDFAAELPRIIDAFSKCFRRDLQLDETGIGVYGDFGILNWPTSAVCFGPPSQRMGTLDRA